MISTPVQEKRKSDSFVNSQEWTLSRAVPDLRLGIVGSLASGKSALVHRYLTGSYMQEESPEGGRFKKEILVDGQSYLLLIRDEGGPPELQFTAWVDAVIFVFSLENEASFNAIYNYYTKMAHFRSAADIPLILVGTQDAISENNPRVIDDARARKLANDLKRCSYYETCATYGLNVERVFQDACQKIVQQRLSSSASCLTPTNSRPSTPNSHFGGAGPGAGGARLLHASPTSNGFLGAAGGGTSSSAGSPAGAGLGGASPSHAQLMALAHKDASCGGGRPSLALPAAPPLLRDGPRAQPVQPPQPPQPPSQPSAQTPSHPCDGPALDNNNGPAARDKFGPPPPPPQGFDNLPPPPPPPASAPPSSLQPPSAKDGKDLPTPSSTPTTSRKSRRRSNLFTPSKKGDDKLRNGGCELGSGRAIPLKQGYLYKRSSKTLNKEWKKKYVTLCDDGRLTYHPSLHDYMDDVHGKEIPLQYVTVKVPGQRPRGTKAIPNLQLGGNGITDGLGSLTISSFQSKEQRRAADKVLLTAFELLREPGGGGVVPGAEEATALAGGPLAALNGADVATPNVKKRHRRMKSSGLRGGANNEGDDSDGYEFFIVSLDNKQWHFEAGNSEERDEWVAAIEQQILTSLQGNESGKAKSRLTGCVDSAAVQAVRTRVPGNLHCADCDSHNPDWASLNLGVVVCIECSGIHRNLGSHISRVRSLDLDDWPPGHLAVMLSLGNSLANSVWEAHTCGRAKPTPNSSREEKERWIRNKYETKDFLASAPTGAPIGQQLLDAVCRSDMKSLALLLAHATTEQVNTSISARDLRTPLHLACATGNLAAAQLLLWHNANAKAVDHEGRTCLAYARAAANVALSKVPPAAHMAAGAPVGSGAGDAGGALATVAALADLLTAHGCSEAAAGAGGTLPRRRGSVGRRDAPPQSTFDRLPASAI